MEIHQITEYKCSKIYPNFNRLYGKDNCQCYAPIVIGGTCRLCGQNDIDHKRWFEYPLMCIKIQNNWRLSKIKKNINFIKKNFLINKFGEDISDIICKKLIEQNGETYKQLILRYKNFI